MYCPNCSHLCGDDHRFCMICGTDLHPETGDVVISPYAKPRKGSHWVPVLILIVLSVLGTLLYFATADRAADPSAPTAPVVQSDTPWFSISNGELYFDESLYTGGSEVTVPDEINGQTVLYLSDGCFASCETITTVHLPDTLEWIGADAFMDCTALRGLYVPSSVGYIGEKAFANCTALEAISVSDSMEYIGFDAFDECNKLYYIFYSGTIDEWDKLYDTYINPYAMVYCEDGSYYQGGSLFK